MSETDIEQRLEEWLRDYGNAGAWEGFDEACKLVNKARATITRLRKRISELEYRDRSRECVGQPAPPTRCYECDGPLNGPYCPACNAEEHCPHCDTTGRCTHVCGWEKETKRAADEGAKPMSETDNTVQILRERSEFYRKQSTHHEMASPQKIGLARIYFAVHLALSETADALEKERKG